MTDATGTTITINLDSPTIKNWAEFWGKLIYAGDVAAQEHQVRGARHGRA